MATRVTNWVYSDTNWTQREVSDDHVWLRACSGNSRSVFVVDTSVAKLSPMVTYALGSKKECSISMTPEHLKLCLEVSMGELTTERQLPGYVANYYFHGNPPPHWIEEKPTLKRMAAITLANGLGGDGFALCAMNASEEDEPTLALFVAGLWYKTCGEHNQYLIDRCSDPVRLLLRTLTGTVKSEELDGFTMDTLEDAYSAHLEYIQQAFGNPIGKLIEDLCVQKLKKESSVEDLLAWFKWLKDWNDPVYLEADASDDRLVDLARVNEQLRLAGYALTL